MCSSPDQLYKIRHSLAHVLAQAVQSMWPNAKLSIGPPIETGCYYDILFPEPITTAHFKELEKKMRSIINQDQTFVEETMSIVDAIAYFKAKAEKFKVELIEDLATKGETTVTLYKNINKEGTEMFVDLCKGGHVQSLKEIPGDCFKIMSLAGAYFRGDEKRDQLTRIYVAAFQCKADLEAHLVQLEEAKKRDHRKIGTDLDLFHFDEDIGKGLPLWLPNGNIIKEALEDWAKETERAWGYKRVTTPIITKENLFYTSGHLPLYKDSMYAPIEIEGDNYYVKPMNCPFHHKIFSARPRTYKDLPLRVAEYGWCHRYEDSGSLFGMMRVRGMQMNDAHIYVSEEQAVEEFIQVIKLHEYYYKNLGITKYEMELALRDPNKMDKYHGDEEDWKRAEKMTTEAMERSGVPFKIVHEGAAFYGPKMDFQIYSSIGRSFTASTNQLDLFMGKKFDLEYIDSDGVKKTPVVIHRAPLGTHERFIGFLIEHFAGHFPLWLSPVQVSLLPVANVHEDYAYTLQKILEEKNIRVELESSTDSLGKRIRNGEKKKIPYLIVLGDKEVTEKSVTVRNIITKQQITIPLQEFVEKVVAENTNRTLQLSIG